MSEKSSRGEIIHNIHRNYSVYFKVLRGIHCNSLWQKKIPGLWNVYRKPWILFSFLLHYVLNLKTAKLVRAPTFAFINIHFTSCFFIVNFLRIPRFCLFLHTHTHRRSLFDIIIIIPSYCICILCTTCVIISRLQIIITPWLSFHSICSARARVWRLAASV